MPGMHPGVPTGERWALLYAAELGRERRQFITRRKLWSTRASSDGAQSMSALLIPDAPGETAVSWMEKWDRVLKEGALRGGPAWYHAHTAQAQVGWLSHIMLHACLVASDSL